ncbi:hypothetical protein BU23DRAFT_661753 [Bimuria novae-zelandiae CBS 107.79]|uniref:Uncharacterized protein n=1 Tax=Bimuria novae-zelandiae CBS 107.79 TaxID=1447943 RepID=A0A6A5UP96_9PLEO|nr:hypothetical protein BU23DRAFT_661753 [Bimuria novae-zelandiae CBS 107.79]
MGEVSNYHQDATVMRKDAQSSGARLPSNNFQQYLSFMAATKAGSTKDASSPSVNTTLQNSRSTCPAANPPVVPAFASPASSPVLPPMKPAFKNTSAVFDDDDPSLSYFRCGGIWTQDPRDIEAICWNLVQAAVSLHVDGAYGLQWRRLPEKLPTPTEQDAKLTFEQRMLCLGLLLRHYKIFAHRMMLQQDLEETLVLIYTRLFQTCQFGIHLRKMPEEYREFIVKALQAGAEPSSMHAVPASRSSATDNHNWRSNKRPLYLSAESSGSPPSKRISLRSPQMWEDPSLTPANLLHTNGMHATSPQTPQRKELSRIYLPHALSPNPLLQTSATPTSRAEHVEAVVGQARHGVQRSKEENVETKAAAEMITSKSTARSAENVESRASQGLEWEAWTTLEARSDAQ